MLFELKKIISALLLPLPICLIFLIIGFFILLLTKARKTGISFVFIGIVVLITFSISPVANDLLYRLENQYQPLYSMPPNVKYIVVLGGGNGGGQHLPPNTQLSSASLARLVEAIRLYRQQPNSILVLSGGGVFGSRSDATVLNNSAIALGIERDHMKIEAGSRDTIEEAKHLKQLIKDEPFILVTSAYHMPRAMDIFKKEGMSPIAAPTQFLVKSNKKSPMYYFPKVSNLIHSDIAIHEYLGMSWLYANEFAEDLALLNKSKRTLSNAPKKKSSYPKSHLIVLT